jgi:biopolymer transport protein ExbD
MLVLLLVFIIISPQITTISSMGKISISICKLFWYRS